jgi:hypothetical protein
MFKNGNCVWWGGRGAIFRRREGGELGKLGRGQGSAKQLWLGRGEGDYASREQGHNRINKADNVGREISVLLRIHTHTHTWHAHVPNRHANSCTAQCPSQRGMATSLANPPTPHPFHSTVAPVIPPPRHTPTHTECTGTHSQSGVPCPLFVPPPPRAPTPPRSCNASLLPYPLLCFACFFLSLRFSFQGSTFSCSRTVAVHTNRIPIQRRPKAGLGRLLD